MCSPIDRKRQSVDQFLVGNHLVLTGRDTGRYSPSFGLLDLLLPAMRAGLLARFLLQGLGWWGARKKGVPLPCVTSVYTTSSRALQRSVTSLRPTTSSPVHVGLPHLRIPQRRSAFFPERSSPEGICASSRLSGWRTISSRTALFPQIHKEGQQLHHDALDFPDGALGLLTDLHEGQQATVLQLPAQPKTLAKQRPRRASCASANIRRITRLPPEPWWCRRLRVPRTPSLLI